VRTTGNHRAPLSDETPAETPVLRTPSHGKGKLRTGGKSRPAGGRPPDKVRAALRKAFDDRIPLLMALAESEDDAVKLKAMDMLAKYGLGTPTAAVDSEGNQTDIPLVAFKPA
jgi:hypothetical protein